MTMPSRSSSADVKKTSSKMTLEVDHYQILGVQRDASCEDIQKAFFRQLQFPKKETKPQTPAMLQARALLRERAYDTLTDEKNREAYDQDLRRSFIYVFVEANGFEVKTTTTRREIVEFLETHDFIGYMRLQGLPVDGAELSLDGVNCFVLRDGKQTWRKCSQTSQTGIENLAPVVDEIQIEASPEEPAMPLPPFSLPEVPSPAFKLPATKVPKFTVPTIKLPSYFQSRKLFELWNVLRTVLLFLLLAWVFLQVPRTSEETRNPSTLLALNDTQASHYDILGVPANATVEDIRRAPRAAILEQDTDDKVVRHLESDNEDINEVMIKIGEAYAMLSSSARCLYDLEAIPAEERKYASCLEGYESILAAGALMKQHVERQKELELKQTQTRTTEIPEAVLNETWAENWTERARTLTEQVSLTVPWHLVTSSFSRFLKFVKRILTAIKDAALAAGTAVSEHVAAAKTSIPEYLRAAKDSVSKHLRDAGGKVHKICYRHESLRLVVFFIGQLIGFDMCNTL